MEKMNIQNAEAQSLSNEKIAGQVARRDGQVGRSTQNKRVTQDMRVNIRVEVVKNNQPFVHKRVERRVETRIYPLKAMQVVDIPHLAKNKGAKGVRNKCDGGASAIYWLTCRGPLQLK